MVGPGPWTVFGSPQFVHIHPQLSTRSSPSCGPSCPQTRLTMSAPDRATGDVLSPFCRNGDHIPTRLHGVRDDHVTNAAPCRERQLLAEDYGARETGYGRFGASRNSDDPRRHPARRARRDRPQSTANTCAGEHDPTQIARREVKTATVSGPGNCRTPIPATLRAGRYAARSTIAAKPSRSATTSPVPAWPNSRLPKDWPACTLTTPPTRGFRKRPHTASLSRKPGCFHRAFVRLTVWPRLHD